MTVRNSIATTCLAAFIALAGYACGDEIESKPENLEPNVSTNNSTANNTTANNGCELDSECDPGQSCLGGQCRESCLLDIDCVASEVCENAACVASCETDADCVVGETCDERVNGPGTVCVPDDGNGMTGCAAEDDPNAFCEAMLGDTAFCDTASGECAEPTPDAKFIVEISDVSTLADACEGTSDPGSDIQGIELQDEIGNTLGWGNIVADSVIVDGNDQANFGVLDGVPPQLDSDGCVESFSGNVLSLGCGGWVAVEFLDESSNPVLLETGQNLVVYEYGGSCGSGNTSDEYSAFICDDTTQVSNEGDNSSCTNSLGTSSGVSSFTVELD